MNGSGKCNVDILFQLDDGILKEDLRPIGLQERYGELKKKSQILNNICIQNF